MASRSVSAAPHFRWLPTSSFSPHSRSPKHMGIRTLTTFPNMILTTRPCGYYRSNPAKPPTRPTGGRARIARRGIGRTSRAGNGRFMMLGDVVLLYVFCLLSSVSLIPCFTFVALSPSLVSRPSPLSSFSSHRLFFSSLYALVPRTNDSIDTMHSATPGYPTSKT